MSKLNEFIANVKSEGLMHNSRFAVSLGVPIAMSSDIELRKMLLFCDAVPLPSISMSTTQARTFGEYREMPYERLFANINMSFFVDNSMQVKGFFDEWMTKIIDPQTRSIGYYKYYISDMVIDVFDIAEQQRYQVKMYECYPKEISQIQLDYANKDVMKLTVSMNYKYWTSSRVEGVSGAIAENVERDDLQAEGFIGDSVSPPKGYFSNFSGFQTAYNSFEQQRNTLFSQVGNLI